MFVDKATIRIKAGNGGNGAVSFHREKYVAAGGPDGGDGGRGGSVVFVPQDGTGTLVDFRYKRKFAAEAGQPGGAKRCFGKSGADCVIPVPRGTLISVVSEAKPEIANYPFTTITPVLGVVRVAEGVSFVMADIPGVIEGASEGVGLGHEFLRHVERCRMLIHVVDVAGSEGRDPLEDFDIINRELQAFNPELAARPMIVAGNKCDLATDEQLEAFAKAMEERGCAYFPMMAAIAHGTKEVVDCCARMLAELPPIRAYEPEPEPLPDADALSGREVTVTCHDGVFFVEGEWLLRLMQGINFDDYESLQYFQRVLQSAGVIDALVKAGVAEGDTVSLYDFEFDFVF